VADITLRIAWPGTAEILFLGTLADLTVGATVSSYEPWPERLDPVRYFSRVEHVARRRESLILRLRYSAEDNPQASINDAWGTTTLEVDLMRRTGSATWRDLRGPDMSVSDATVSVDQEPGTAQSGLRLVKDRLGQQNRFRKMLLGLDGACAVTREQHPALLDAAHVLELNGRGNYSRGNGLLLRTDVHRLFDRRVLRIDLDGCLTYVGESKPTSLRALTKMRLNKHVLDRISKNLASRLESDDA
jgi:hypothetical protein